MVKLCVGRGLGTTYTKAEKVGCSDGVVCGPGPGDDLHQTSTRGWAIYTLDDLHRCLGIHTKDLGFHSLISWQLTWDENSTNIAGRKRNGEACVYMEKTYASGMWDSVFKYREHLCKFYDGTDQTKHVSKGI